jgi:hypothetical protein
LTYAHLVVIDRCDDLRGCEAHHADIVQVSCEGMTSGTASTGQMK